MAVHLHLSERLEVPDITVVEQFSAGCCQNVSTQESVKAGHGSTIQEVQSVQSRENKPSIGSRNPYSTDIRAWSLELGAWSLELGAWSLELGAWSLVALSC